MKKLSCRTLSIFLFSLILIPQGNVLANNIDVSLEEAVKRKLTPCLAFVDSPAKHAEFVKNRFGCMVHRAESLRMNLAGQWAALVNSTDPEVRSLVGQVKGGSLEKITERTRGWLTTHPQDKYSVVWEYTISVDTLKRIQEFGDKETQHKAYILTGIDAYDKANLRSKKQRCESIAGAPFSYHCLNSQDWDQLARADEGAGLLNSDTSDAQLFASCITKHDPYASDSTAYRQVAKVATTFKNADPLAQPLLGVMSKIYGSNQATKWGDLLRLMLLLDARGAFVFQTGVPLPRSLVPNSCRQFAGVLTAPSDNKLKNEAARYLGDVQQPAYLQKLGQQAAVIVDVANALYSARPSAVTVENAAYLQQQREMWALGIQFLGRLQEYPLLTAGFTPTRSDPYIHTFVKAIHDKDQRLPLFRYLKWKDQTTPLTDSQIQQIQADLQAVAADITQSMDQICEAAGPYRLEHIMNNAPLVKKTLDIFPEFNPLHQCMQQIYFQRHNTAKHVDTMAAIASLHPAGFVTALGASLLHLKNLNEEITACNVSLNKCTLEDVEKLYGRRQSEEGMFSMLAAGVVFTAGSRTAQLVDRASQDFRLLRTPAGMTDTAHRMQIRAERILSSGTDSVTLSILERERLDFFQQFFLQVRRPHMVRNRLALPNRMTCFPERFHPNGVIGGSAQQIATAENAALRDLVTEFEQFRMAATASAGTSTNLLPQAESAALTTEQYLAQIEAFLSNAGNRSIMQTESLILYVTETSVASRLRQIIEHTQSTRLVEVRPIHLTL